MKREYYLQALKARKLMNKALNGIVKNHVNGYGCWAKDLKRSLNSCACCAIVGMGDDGIHISPNQACHAGLDNAYEGRPQNGNAIAVVSSIQTNYNGGHGFREFTEEEHIQFIDWMINRSPWAKLGVFVNKSAKDVFKNGYIVNTDVPSNLMAGALIATRVAWEYTKILRSWLNMVKHGVNENAAFYIAHVYCVTKAKATYSGMSGHCALDGSSQTTIDDIIAFRDAKPVEYKLNPTYRDNSAYRGIHGLFTLRKDETLGQVIKRRIKGGKGVNHIFKAAEVIQRRAENGGNAVYGTKDFCNAIKEIFNV